MARPEPAKPRAKHESARRRVAKNIERLMRETGITTKMLETMFNSNSMAREGKEKARGYNLDTLGRLADFFECDISELFMPLPDDPPWRSSPPSSTPSSGSPGQS